MTDYGKYIKKAVLNLKYALSKFSQLLIKNFKYDKYKKFIVLTRSRTGSNLLISMINSHLSMYAAGEIFAKLSGKTVKKILSEVYCKHSCLRKAVGFKIFYYHPLDDKSGLIWQELNKIENLYIIHLKRKNILKTLLSRKIAGKTDIWKENSKNHSKSTTKNKRISLTKKELLEGFQETRKWENSYSDLFTHNKTVEIYYEDLIANPQYEFRRITDMLNLKSAPLETQLKKQNPEKLSDLIENYALMKEEFINTEWSAFFEE